MKGTHPALLSRDKHGKRIGYLGEISPGAEFKLQTNTSLETLQYLFILFAILNPSPLSSEVQFLLWDIFPEEQLANLGADNKIIKG